MTDAILITPHGISWAVKHNGGFLGYAKSREEAVLIGQDLVEWLAGQGRVAALVVEEPRSFRGDHERTGHPPSSPLH